MVCPNIEKTSANFSCYYLLDLKQTWGLIKLLKRISKDVEDMVTVISKQAIKLTKMINQSFLTMLLY